MAITAVVAAQSRISNALARQYAVQERLHGVMRKTLAAIKAVEGAIAELDGKLGAQTSENRINSALMKKSSLGQQQQQHPRSFLENLEASKNDPEALQILMLSLGDDDFQSLDEKSIPLFFRGILHSLSQSNVQARHASLVFLDEVVAAFGPGFMVAHDDGAFVSTCLSHIDAMLPDFKGIDALSRGQLATLKIDLELALRQYAETATAPHVALHG